MAQAARCAAPHCCDVRPRGSHWIRQRRPRLAKCTRPWAGGARSFRARAHHREISDDELTPLTASTLPREDCRRRRAQTAACATPSGVAADVSSPTRNQTRSSRAMCQSPIPQMPVHSRRTLARRTAFFHKTKFASSSIGLRTARLKGSRHLVRQMGRTALIKKRMLGRH